MIKSRMGECIDKEAVEKFNEQSADWTGTCRHCHINLRGTLSELRSHVCEIKHGE